MGVGPVPIAATGSCEVVRASIRARVLAGNGVVGRMRAARGRPREQLPRGRCDQGTADRRTRGEGGRVHVPAGPPATPPPPPPAPPPSLERVAPPAPQRTDARGATPPSTGHELTRSRARPRSARAMDTAETKRDDRPVNRADATRRIRLTRRLLSLARDHDRYDPTISDDLRAAAAIVRGTVPEDATHDDSPVELWDPRTDLL